MSPTQRTSINVSTNDISQSWYWFPKQWVVSDTKGDLVWSNKLPYTTPPSHTRFLWLTGIWNCLGLCFWTFCPIHQFGEIHDPLQIPENYPFFILSLSSRNSTFELYLLYLPCLWPPSLHPRSPYCVLFIILINLTTITLPCVLYL